MLPLGVIPTLFIREIRWIIMNLHSFVLENMGREQWYMRNALRGTLEQWLSTDTQIAVKNNFPRTTKIELTFGLETARGTKESTL